ncbi:AAA family ATPase [Streptomyces sp. NPDC005423]|uniref:AAA family ATPase n=1 Tax=Streptomyces sp. NPDC005423 TaxID=3155343 RepID=UPI0033B61904
MTAPLTPPPPPRDQSSHEHSSHDQSPRDGSARDQAPRGAWPTPDAGYPEPGPHDEPSDEDGPGLKTEIREAVVITVALAVGGALLGLLWWWLAPHVPLVGDVTGKSWVVYLKDSEGEQAVGVDGTFTLLAVAFGAVTALAVFLLRRRGGVPLAVALAVGGLLGSLLAWRLGVWLGPTGNVIAHAKSVGKGVTFSAPLKLGAKGALLAWSVAALVVHLGLTALFGPRDPEPPYQQAPLLKDPYGAPQP